VHAGQRATRRRLVEGLGSYRIVALWFLFISADAFGQLSGSATLLSDYRFRGISLSHERPAAQLSLAYDDGSGWYGGAFASTVQLGDGASRELQGMSFIGYARRTPSGLSWEVGADYSVVTGDRSYSYPEAYAGVAFENVSARLYYAPRYFGQGSEAIYGEINASHQLLDRVLLIAHGGMLWNNSDNSYNRRPDHRVFDASMGVALDLDPFNVQLNWVGISSSNTLYPVAVTGRRNRVVLVLSRSF
jgi:uncharacterized protein (TIGR02001 family)